ncbi:MAG: hypothetical protein F6K21_19460 [Symploca sp. SIO2D2]|nr:hypothetical protein [Symploca sp. SIO2D2]
MFAQEKVKTGTVVEKTWSPSVLVGKREEENIEVDLTFDINTGWGGQEKEEIKIIPSGESLPIY